jgi:hypothetical protein
MVFDVEEYPSGQAPKAFSFFMLKRINAIKKIVKILELLI